MHIARWVVLERHDRRHLSVSVDAKGADGWRHPRRFCYNDRAKAEAWATLPDLLIVDGGRGQLNAALDVLREADLEPIVPAAGLAKRNEELYVNRLAEPIVLPRNSQALYLSAVC